MILLEKCDLNELERMLTEELDKPAPDRTTVMQVLKEFQKRDAKTSDRVLDAWNEPPMAVKKPRKPHVWGRIAVAAALGLVLLGVVPSALGVENIFTMIGNWTRDIFSFSEPEEEKFIYKTDHPGLQELYDTVSGLDVSRNVVPAWLPEGYELQKLSSQETPIGTMVFASFVQGEKYIGIRVKNFNTTEDTLYQKNAEDAFLYERAGVQHYIFTNEDLWTAAWIVDNMECAISAETKDDLYAIIDSIYTEEK